MHTQREDLTTGEYLKGKHLVENMRTTSHKERLSSLSKDINKLLNIHNEWKYSWAQQISIS